MAKPKKISIQRKTEDLRYKTFKEILEMNISPDASLEYDYDYYYGDREVESIYFSWYDLETDEEYAKRLEAEKAKRKLIEQAQKKAKEEAKAAEYQIYLSLKQKFES